MSALAAITALAALLEQDKENKHQSFDVDTLIKFREKERQAWMRWFNFAKEIKRGEPTELESAELDFHKSDFMFYRQLREAAGKAYGMAGGEAERDLPGVVKEKPVIGSEKPETRH